MSSLRANQALVADEILLDGRLALFHRQERWLAVADLHFGYELSQRAAGRLVPIWGMASIAERHHSLSPRASTANPQVDRILSKPSESCEPLQFVSETLVN